MRILVVYASHCGSTRAIAERIGAALDRSGIEATVASAQEAPDPVGFDACVVGSAVHGGHWLLAASSFVRQHASTLARQPVWLFSSGPVGDRAAAAPQPDPEEIAGFRRAIGPREHRVFGGAFDRATADLSDLGLVERTIVKRFLPDGDWRDWPAIDAWTADIAHALERTPAPA